MDRLYIARSWSVIAEPSFWGVGRWASSDVFPQITPFNEIGNLFFQLKTVLSVVSVVPVEFTIFVPISLLGVSLDLPRPFDEFFMFNFREYLGNGGVEWW